MAWQDLIKLQIDSNRQLNLVSSRHENGFHFAGTTQELIKRIVNNLFSSEEEEELLLYTTQVTLSTLYQINQYYQFDQQAEKQLKSIYKQLLLDIKIESDGEPDFDNLAKTHYLRLQKWLIAQHPETLTYYPTTQPVIENTVVCAEYSALTQLNTLGISITNLQEPILDVGCGKEHNLVNYLQKKGYNVYGIDRDIVSSENLVRSSWMDYKFQPDHWGTIISHLGFTNHFIHHHLKAGSDHLLYAKKYIEIIQSLKIRGRFYYTPDLPFIEFYLDPYQYSIKKKQVHQTHFYSASIERLK
ncbi:hypothetical protein FC093_03030 [Ilyomonas limi]|uniref:Uncharacterized protein n=1 Tax=Ilyomonas limi TaxID=2575867 RepID=A0A4U3LA23_9BACT|nr:hypothetical protein [Ilyomonas limi]TKK72000.1 hypothetical protein FC093_03030 [Ilyomonas limi]